MQRLFTKEIAMRRLLTTTAALTFVLTIAGATQAQAQIITLTAELSGANETPAPGVLTGAFGFAVVRLDVGGRSWDWTVDVFNMPSGTNNAHFHVGGPGLAGPTVVNIPYPAGISNDYRLTGSARELSSPRPDQGIRSVDDFIQAMVGGQVYVNIHSAVNGGGEIRGQLRVAP
jgi:hypothetical protein